MNWEAIGALSEATGVIAILISLVYVAIQIRQGTQELTRSIEANQLAAFEQNVESGNHIRELLLLHPDLVELLSDGYASYAKLDASKRMRFGMLIRNIFSSVQGAYVRQLVMAHDPEEFLGTVRVLDEVLVHRGVQEWLETNKPDWRSEFRELVDQRLETIKQNN